MEWHRRGQRSEGEVTRQLAVRSPSQNNGFPPARNDGSTGALLGAISHPPAHNTRGQDPERQKTFSENKK